MLTIAVIMGLGEDPAAGCLGLRSYLEELKKTFDIDVKYFSHAEDNLHTRVLELPRPLAGIGHSNGGDDLWFIGEENKGEYLEFGLFLDPKQEWNSFWNTVAWFLPLNYAVPDGFMILKNFHGSFGRGFKNNAFSTKLDIDHEDFPSNPLVQGWIKDQLMSFNLLKAPEGESNDTI